MCVLRKFAKGPDIGIYNLVRLYMSGEKKVEMPGDDVVRRRRSPSQLAKQRKKAKEEEGLRRRRAASRINRAATTDRMILLEHPGGTSLATPEKPEVVAPSGQVRVKFKTRNDLTDPRNLLMTAGAGALAGAVAGGAAHHLVHSLSGYTPRVGGDIGALFGATHAVTKAAQRKVQDRRGTLYSVPTEGSKATVIESQGNDPSIPSYEVPMTRKEFERKIPRLQTGLRRRRRMTRGMGKKRRRRTRGRRKRRTRKRRKRRRTHKRCR